MKSYVYKRNKDGIHYLDLAKTWEKLMVAARVVAATQAKNKTDVLVSFRFSLPLLLSPSMSVGGALSAPPGQVSMTSLDMSAFHLPAC